MMNDFDKIAPYYDFLGRLFFGPYLKISQLKFIDKIPDHSRILIIGGGTGWIIREICNKVKHPDFVYVESSKKMIKLSKKSINENTSIRYYHGPVENFKNGGTFDVLITNFFLDLYSDEDFKLIINKLKGNLKKDGFWLFTDFQVSGNYISRFIQRCSLYLMYRFFMVTATINNKKLPEMNRGFSEEGFKLIHQAEFFKKFITSKVYQYS